jgi:CHAD domain-containing protein
MNRAKSEAKTFGDWAYVAIAKHFNKTLQHEVGVLQDKDPEELHQMRVGMRRLRGAIADFTPALDLPKAAEGRKVGKVARILGTLRDIDVLDEILQNQYRPFLPAIEKRRLNQAIKALSTQRQDAFAQVQLTLEGNLYQSLIQAFQNWLAEPSYQEIGEISIQAILPDLLLPQISKLLLHPGWMVGVTVINGESQFPESLDEQEIEQLLEDKGVILHDLRKEAKRTRYSMELFAHFYGNAYQNHLKDIKALQTVLGDIQDRSVLTEFLSQIFASDLTIKLPIFVDILTGTRQQEWREWISLQKRFLDLKNRKDFRAILLKPTFTGKNKYFLDNMPLEN